MIADMSVAARGIWKCSNAVRDHVKCLQPQRSRRAARRGNARNLLISRLFPAQHESVAPVTGEQQPVAETSDAQTPAGGPQVCRIAKNRTGARQSPDA
jgi:hypothetical protein